jgi:flagellar L-ring protein precursor FlgH
MPYCLISIGLALILWGGSAHADEHSQIDPPGLPAEPQGEQRNVAVPADSGNNGSLWSEEGHRAFLFEDQKARQTGDVVTVRIVESSSGVKNASTKTEKDSSLKASIASLFGMSTDKLSAETGSASKFDGSGSTSRSDQLTATVTARVTSVLSNGNLVIDGKREVLVNKERQYILLSGVIRPEDIGPNNTILSSYIADANISYTGTGVINDKQRPGWFIRIFDFLWPF